MEYGLKVSKSNITHVASGKMLQVDILNVKLYINLVWAGVQACTFAFHPDNITKCHEKV
jgi:hypothetical protein